MEYSAIFIPIVTLVTAQLTVLDLARFRFNKRKIFLIVLIEFIFQITITLPILLFHDLSLYAKSYFFTMHLPAYITFWYITKRRDLRDVFTVLLTIFLSFSISVPAAWISRLQGNIYLSYNIIRIIVFAMIFPFLHFVVRRHYLQVQDEIDKGWALFCALPVIGSAILYYKYWQFSMNGNFSSIVVDCFIVIILMATAFLIFFYFFEQLHEKYIMQEQQRILTLQNKAQSEQFKQQREEADKTNRRWHDMRHNLQDLIDLLEEGRTDKALTYLKNQRGIDLIPREEYCLHPAVNSILCLWAERSRKAGIHVEIKTDIPENLAIEPMELTVLFANAFENAYEGCLRLSNDTKKIIKIDAHHNGRRLAIGITNTCMENIRFEDDIPLSSKTGGGIGIQSIAYTVRRFRGVAYYEAKEGIFTARFVLNI